ncbi:unnamed protein product [Nezara viridula]|uniref:Lipase domain-containing protein n=1 Tax=Nezara viridula TaxID=85310 RepID=A0A9P0MV92_NEZVI|nr:unnamed protein product [Nezara viridula]CAH1408429.1 unnamed protein product [Nezara viridula]
MDLRQLLVGILVVIMSVEVRGENCFYADNDCPNGNISFWLRTRETDVDGFEITEENLEQIPLIENAPLILALDGCYITSAYNVPIAGRCTARLLQQLYTRRGKHWKNLTHVVGFSMGAHVAGVVGYHLPKLPRITGLDPALPLFTAATSRIENRLDPSDADFVDVYHTNGGWQGRLGVVGQVDFYLNNGATQPGCHFSMYLLQSYRFIRYD